MTQRYWDPINGVDTNNGTSTTTPKKTLGAFTTVTAGDTINGVGIGPVTGTHTATWTKQSKTVTLSAALTQGLYTDGAWTSASSNVTCTADTTTYKQGASSAKMAITSSFGTGLAAYVPTGSGLNLNGYQQLSFWIKSSENIVANVLEINLCENTNGTGVLNTFVITRFLSANQWTLMTINWNAALGSPVNSVAFGVIAAPSGAYDIWIDNVNACVAPSNANPLTMSSLISPDNLNFFGIQSINGPTVDLDLDVQTGLGSSDINSDSSLNHGWDGTTGSYTLYILNPIPLSTGEVYAGSTGTSGAGVININGYWTSGFGTSGGKQRMIFDGVDGTINGLTLPASMSYLEFTHFGFIRFAKALATGASCTNLTFQGLALSNNSATISLGASNSNMTVQAFTDGSTSFSHCNIGDGLPFGGNEYNLTSITCLNNSGNGLSIAAGAFGGSLNTCTFSNNNGHGLSLASVPSWNTFYNVTASDNHKSGFYFTACARLVAYNLTATANSGSSNGNIYVDNQAEVEIYGLTTGPNTGSTVGIYEANINGGNYALIYNWSSTDVTKVSVSGPGSQVISHRDGGNINNNFTYSALGTMASETGTVETGASIAWELQPTSLQADSFNPLRILVGTVACPASLTTTVQYYGQISNAGITGTLRIFGGRYPGVGTPGADITTAITSVGSFAQYSIAVTPTENCVVDIYAEAHGGTTYNAIVSGPVTITQ